jgi:uncharacterized protein (TIGR00255 family)
MLSMTGFGSGEAQIGNLSLTVELRSVNHRFLDVGLKVPGALVSYEGDIRKFLKDHVARGRVTVSAQLVQGRGDRDAAMDPERLAQGLAMVKSAAAALEKETGEKHPVTLEHLLSVPDLFRAEEAELDSDELKKGLMTALEGALAGLNAMKEAEGAALVAEMRGRLDTLVAKLAEVEKLAPQAAVEVQARLEERLGKLLTEGLDPQRLAQEVALLADKANINEECERLGIHLASYRDALESGGQVAKKLNFLLQEMHREVNTMGSKTNLMEITQAVIVMKEEVESLREQVQNLE